ncbi:hypothetical protein [Nonomuraea wenchangensis]|uniref:Uncharacterized protein n=1 Tax=Nonomuraea wenchangensis TaxID=568860 RepID=A0A1I0LV05_9ACTN|nr:hypothetical protein [Nonomuraea wenchangensis]SEU46408.1 hypothetical protein SAMN05421811_12726 [Nonomuraea wenchangensis]
MKTPSDVADERRWQNRQRPAMPDQPRAAVWNDDRTRAVAVIEGRDLTDADLEAARRLADHPNIHHHHTFQE